MLENTYKKAVSQVKQRRIIQNYILRYKNSVPLCVFLVHSVVKFNRRGHGDENAKITEANIIW